MFIQRSSRYQFSRRIFYLWFLCFPLIGCGPLAATPGGFNLISGQAEILSIIGTDKTIADHVISLGSGKNCSTVRRERGLHYCEEDEPEAKAQVYCYNTLARVTCYGKPDPHQSGARRLGINDHNLVRSEKHR